MRQPVPIDRTEAVDRLLAIETIAKAAIEEWRLGNVTAYPFWAREMIEIIKGGLPSP